MILGCWTKQIRRRCWGISENKENNLDVGVVVVDQGTILYIDICCVQTLDLVGGWQGTQAQVAYCFLKFWNGLFSWAIKKHRVPGQRSGVRNNLLTPRDASCRRPRRRQEVLHGEAARFGPARWYPVEVSEKRAPPYVLLCSNSK